MAFWKNEYAVQVKCSREEEFWSDSCDEAVEYAKKEALRYPGVAYQIVAIRRMVDERTECESYVATNSQINRIDDDACEEDD